jgi:hypothetical protein
MKGQSDRKQSSVSLGANTAPLPKSEWDFERVPDHLVHHCWLWEFCRELYLQNEELRAAVEAYWIKMNAEDDWRCHVKNDGRWPDSRGGEVFTTENVFWRTDPLGGGNLRYLTRAELCSIRDSHKILAGWDEVMGRNLTDEEEIQRLMDFDRGLGLQAVFPEILTLVCNTEIGESREEISINWSKSDSDLVKQFKKWLNSKRLENRSLPCLSPQQGRGKRPCEIERTQLKKLGVFRLIRAHKTINKVIKALKQRDFTLPYVDASNWSKAISDAEKVLAELGRKCRQDLQPNTQSSISV